VVQYDILANDKEMGPLGTIAAGVDGAAAMMTTMS
jgi:hypothetical protein